MINHQAITDLISRAIAEDMPWSDITTDALFPSLLHGTARIIAREDIVVSGIEAASATFMQIDPSLEVSVLVKNGALAKKDDQILSVEGDLRFILRGERIALNFLQRLSGIATLTSMFVSAIDGFDVKISDTRKTTPTLRLLEKKAVADGGGHNHRFSLSDAVMIKDTHLSFFPDAASAVKKVKQHIPHTVKVEVELSRLEDIEPAVLAGADIIMLDNMRPDEVKNSVDIIAGRCVSEASGNIDINNVRQYAETGVDVISVGSLTHSARAVDIHMKTERLG